MRLRSYLAALAAPALLAGATSIQAAPITFTFSGSDEDGTGSATMTIDIVGQILTATVDNTSPTTLDDGTGVNTPGITGFGFDLEEPVPEVDDWWITAFDTGGNNVIIGDQADSTDGTWIIDGTIGGLTLDVLACDDDPNCDAIQGALYNPDAEEGFGAEPNYFTTAVLTMEFDATPTLDQFLGNCTGPSPCSPFVRFQNVGDDGEGSLRLGGTPDNGGPPEDPPLPVPGTLGLLGLGLVALGVAGRRRWMMASR